MDVLSKELGLNYRLTDIQSSLGISQLKKLKNFLKKREFIFKIYSNSLKNLPLILPTKKKHIKYLSFISSFN